MSQNSDKRKHGLTRKDVVMPVPTPGSSMPGDYGLFFENLKPRIKLERFKVVFSANAALIYIRAAILKHTALFNR